MTTIIRTSNIADVIAGAHYRLGFVPTESLVAVALGQDGRVGLVLRIDLTGAYFAASALAEYMGTSRAASVVLLVYTDDQAEGTVAAEAATSALGTLPRISWQVSTTGYRRLDHDGPEFPLDDITASRMAVECIGAGQMLGRTRADLLPSPATEAAKTVAIAEATNRDVMTPGEALALWQDVASGKNTPTAATYGALAAALESRLVRDAVLVATIPGTPQDLPAAIVNQTANPHAVSDALDALLKPEHAQKPGEAAETYALLLAAVIAHTDGSTHATPALTLWGLLKWWNGDGTSANVAIGKALDERPDYRLALLLDQTLSAGLAPGWVRQSL